MNLLSFRNWPFMFKLIFLSIISLIPLTLLLLFIVMPSIEEQWYENKYAATKNNVESVFNTLEYYNSKASVGLMSLDSAKMLAAEVISAQRYDGTNYFWINDLDHIIIAHPLRPERIGKSAADMADANGKLLYVEFVNVCKASGEGYVEYAQKKSGVEEPQPKVSYLKLYKPWGWIIGSGVYLNDVSESVGEFKSNIIFAGIAALIIAIIAGFIIARITSNPLKLLTQAADLISTGNFNARVDFASSDEFGKLAVTFNSMIKTIKSTVEKVEEETKIAEQAAKEAEIARNKAVEQETYLDGKVRLLLTEMEKFSAGDLTVELPVQKDDIIGQLFKGFNHAIARLRNMIVKVQEATVITANTSHEISASTEEISTTATMQNSQVNEVAGAVNEMSITLQDTTKNIHKATEASKQAGTIAREGGNIVLSTIAGMNKIADVVNNAAETVSALGENSDKIGEIIQVIDDIADQTNLLALNAAIEAARAGEQGRGFAVVADEVRKLAERTTKATKEIAEMIKKIQRDTYDAVNSIKQGTSEVEMGKNLASQAGDSLNQIIASTTQVIDLITSIATASEEQSSASALINQNVDTLSNMTNEFNAAIQQIANNVEDMNKLNENLSHLMKEFKLGSSGLMRR